MTAARELQDHGGTPQAGGSTHAEGTACLSQLAEQQRTQLADLPGTLGQVMSHVNLGSAVQRFPGRGVPGNNSLLNKQHKTNKAIIF